MLQFNKCNFDNCNKKFKISALKCRCGNFYCTILDYQKIMDIHIYSNEQDKKYQNNRICFAYPKK